MGKIILFLVLAAVAYLIIKGATRAGSGRSRTEDRAGKPAESMKACARCGVNVPRSEVLEADGRYFCSDEHRRLGSD